MKLYIATLPNGYFGNAPNSWDTLDIKLLAQPFSNFLNIEYISITDIPKVEFNNSDILFYTSFDNLEIINYLKDNLYFIKDKCKIIPRYEILCAHENKGFQEVLRKELNIDRLSGDYYIDVDQIDSEPPFVLKTLDGSGSSGVRLVRNNEDLESIKRTVLKVNNKRKLKNFFRSKHLTIEQYNRYQYFYKNFKRYITQPFLNNLTCDYRVLAIGDHFYAMRRDVRKGDFRASGSKKFKYDEAPIEVLNYAHEIHSKLDTPFLSMDLAYKDGIAYLIEFQGTNFGSSVIRKSKGYFTLNSDEEWIFIDENPVLEKAISYGLFKFLNIN